MVSKGHQAPSSDNVGPIKHPTQVHSPLYVLYEEMAAQALLSQILNNTSITYNAAYYFSYE